MSEFKTNKISPRKGTTQTIGDSGDTVSIPSGVTLSNAGTISGIQNIDWNTTKKTSAFTAVNQTGYFVDTTSAAITVTFPASPSAGNVIGLKDYANTFDTNNLTINPNGNKIQGLTIDFIVSDKGAALNFIYVDATRGWVLTDASKASDIAEGPTFIVATGGTVTTCGDFKTHTFTGPGTFNVCSLANCAVGAGPNNVDYLVVAGGGGASAEHAGGGGAGGARIGACTSCTGLTVTATTYPITVGAGGSGSTGSSTSSGSNSIFSTITSTGGGRGGSYFAAGDPGGSGGGSAGGDSTVPTSSQGSGNTPPVSPPQGNPGGTGGPSGPNAGGGGGGASAAGGNFPSNNGGAGLDVTPVFGTAPQPFYQSDQPQAGPSSTGLFAGGGSGTSGPPGAVVPGGPGGGGDGGGGVPTSQPAGSGTANTGGGGGGLRTGSGVAGGSGGSGIVVIRYKYQ